MVDSFAGGEQVCELLMSAGDVAGAAWLLRRAMTFSTQHWWQQRIAALADAEVSLASHVAAGAAEIRDRDILRLESPSMADFVECAACTASRQNATGDLAQLECCQQFFVGNIQIDDVVWQSLPG
jgi:glutathione S-transferase